MPIRADPAGILTGEAISNAARIATLTEHPMPSLPPLVGADSVFLRRGWGHESIQDHFLPPAKPRRMTHRRFAPIGVLTLAAICLVNLPNAFAQSGMIELTKLPQPPSQIAELLKRANVRFCYGPQEKPPAMTMPNGRRLGALTVYKMNYDFRTQSRVKRRGNRQHLVTTIRLG